MSATVEQLFTEVGRSVDRRDADAKMRGEAEFAGDVEVPRMLHGKVLRSEVAHGRIARIDTSEAEAMPGVACVMTGADLSGIDPYYGHALKDRPLLALDRVRFAGEPIAAVAAETEAAAEAALLAIAVEYEELPVVGTLEEALADDAPRLHEEPVRAGLFHGLGLLEEEAGNVCYRYRLDSGSVEGAGAEAQIEVEGEYRFPAVYQYAMETHTVVCDFREDAITLWASCQHPFLVRAEIADLFGKPLNSVRVIVPYLGGGFGSKSYTKMEPITAALARHAGRPVRIQNSVAESMLTTRRHGMRAWMRTRARADGTLLSREVRFDLDTGAYADNGPRVCATAGDAAPGPYRWRAVRVDGSCVYTCTSPAGSYRAFGACHLQWIGESQVDEVARRAGLDPLELRRRNLLTPGELVRPTGGKPLDADLIGDVEKVAEAIGWDEPAPPEVGRGCFRRPARRGRPPGVARLGPPGARWRGRGERRAPPRSVRALAPSWRRSPRRSWRSTPPASESRALIRRSRRTTARPARAARPRSRAWPFSARPPTFAVSCSRPRGRRWVRTRAI